MSKIGRWFVVLPALLSACTASKPVPVDKARITATIMAIEADIQASFNAHDPERNVIHDEPGIVIMNHGAPNLVGVPAELAGKRRIFAHRLSSYTLSGGSVEVADSGELAIYRGTYAFSHTDPVTKKPAVEYGNDITGFRKQANGDWKVAWMVVSDTGAPAKPPSGP